MVTPKRSPVCQTMISMTSTSKCRFWSPLTQPLSEKLASTAIRVSILTSKKRRTKVWWSISRAKRINITKASHHRQSSSIIQSARQPRTLTDTIISKVDVKITEYQRPQLQVPNNHVFRIHSTLLILNSLPLLIKMTLSRDNSRLITFQYSRNYWTCKTIKMFKIV